MATRKQAELAAERHAERLRRLGAHAVYSADGRDYGRRGHVIVTWVPPGFEGKLPASVSSTIDGARVSVPVERREVDPLRPEAQRKRGAS